MYQNVFRTSNDAEIRGFVHLFAAQAGQLAQRRLARGLRLNHPEVRLRLRIWFLVLRSVGICDYSLLVYIFVRIAKLLEIQNLLLLLSLLVFLVPTSLIEVNMKVTRLICMLWGHCTVDQSDDGVDALGFYFSASPRARLFGNVNAASTRVLMHSSQSMCCKCLTVAELCTRQFVVYICPFFVQFSHYPGLSEMVNLLQHWWTWESNCLDADRCLPVPEWIYDTLESYDIHINIYTYDICGMYAIYYVCVFPSVSGLQSCNLLTSAGASRSREAYPRRAGGSAKIKHWCITDSSQMRKLGILHVLDLQRQIWNLLFTVQSTYSLNTNAWQCPHVCRKWGMKGRIG